MSKQVPAQFAAWIECERCGRIDKTARDFQLPEDAATPHFEKIRMDCERCGQSAFMHLQRTIPSKH
jgi:ribosomal protein S14